MNQTLSINQVQRELRRKYTVLHADKPLAVGIHKELIAIGEYPESAIKAVLSRHTKSRTYLYNVKRSNVRYNLNGEAVGVVNDTQRELTRLRLNRITAEVNIRQVMAKPGISEKKIGKLNTRLKNINAKTNVKIDAVLKSGVPSV